MSPGSGNAASRIIAEKKPESAVLSGSCAGEQPADNKC